MKHRIPDNVSASERSRLIDEWIFDEKHRVILKRRLLDGITFEALAEENDMSVSQIKTIIYKGMQRLLSHL